jgi:18S rRNA (guanine1575-N7)-methyltransferase
LDVSEYMLALAAAQPPAAGRLCLADMCQGLPARAGAFHAAVSISAVQRLCLHEAPHAAAERFMAALESCLAPGAQAALQVYTEGE